MVTILNTKMGKVASFENFILCFMRKEKNRINIKICNIYCSFLSLKLFSIAFNK